MPRKIFKYLLLTKIIKDVWLTKLNKGRKSDCNDNCKKNVILFIFFFYKERIVIYIISVRISIDSAIIYLYPDGFQLGYIFLVNKTKILKLGF